MEQCDRKKFKLSELLSFLKSNDLLTDQVSCGRMTLRGFSPITKPKPNTVSWVRERLPENVQLDSVVVLCPPDFQTPTSSGGVFIPVKEPRKAFAELLGEFAVPKEMQPAVIAKTAVISDKAILGDDVSVGEYSVIESDVTIGCRTAIENHVCIKSGTIIGDDCIIRSGVIIGSDGFGFYKENAEKWCRFPQVGGVMIEKNVEIGSSSIIDKATLDDTVIAEGTKIDAHVYIAHNSRIGPNNIIAAKVTMAGSVTTGKNVWIGPASSILENCHIGDNAFIGMSTAVIKSVEPNCKVAGVPGKVIGKTV